MSRERAGSEATRDEATIPESLRAPELHVVWERVRRQLDRGGPERRGTVRLPALSSSATLVLSSLLDRTPTARLDLAQLERALHARCATTDLDQALTLLGAPPSPEHAERRASRVRKTDIGRRVRAAVSGWPEPWAGDWGEDVLRSGQFAKVAPPLAASTVDGVRRLLDVLNEDDDESPSRNELAARLYGSAHALDDGTLVERCARRALWWRTGKRRPPGETRDIWSDAGITTDSVSAPVLAWRLPLEPTSALGAIATAAADARVPVHLSRFALTRHPLVVSNTEPVLLVENPRLVEAAAERRERRCVIATNGNPVSSVSLLIDALLAAGVEVRSHADFDAAGIAICRRLNERGCRPWRMGADDYRRALEAARRDDIELPIDPSTCGPTPWDAALEDAFGTTRRIVHEELLIDVLLDAASGQERSVRALPEPSGSSGSFGP